jgi:hypothetical protein
MLGDSQVLPQTSHGLPAFHTLQLEQSPFAAVVLESLNLKRQIVRFVSPFAVLYR